MRLFRSAVMTYRIGIRREDKNKWERRVPLVPEHVKEFKKKYDVETVIKQSKIRVYSDDEYSGAGAVVKEDLSTCPIVFAVKEIPMHLFEKNKAYVFFSHTIKGQKYNMPMLKKMMDLECTLIDYEKIVNERGFRLVFFGRYAGLAGMIDTLWALGQRLAWEGISNPFEAIKRANAYYDLDEAKAAVRRAGAKIASEGLPVEIEPLIVEETDKRDNFLFRSTEVLSNPFGYPLGGPKLYVHLGFLVGKIRSLNAGVRFNANPINLPTAGQIVPGSGDLEPRVPTTPDPFD